MSAAVALRANRTGAVQSEIDIDREEVTSQEHYCSSGTAPESKRKRAAYQPHTWQRDKQRHCLKESLSRRKPQSLTAQEPILVMPLGSYFKTPTLLKQNKTESLKAFFPCWLFSYCTYSEEHHSFIQAHCRAETVGTMMAAAGLAQPALKPSDQVSVLKKPYVKWRGKTD